jgi:hypothetical protein
MAYVYRHIRLDKNEPFYIGIGSSANHERAKTKKGRNTWWKKVSQKTAWRVDILCDDISWEKANEKEIEFIKLYGRADLNNGTLVNLTDGGGGVLGRIKSEETREKQRKSMLGKNKGNINKYRGIKLPKEIVEQRNSARITNGKVKKGYPHTAESKNKIRVANTGRITSIETRKKMSEIAKNRVFSDDTKRKISKRMLGNKYLLGHTHSDETKLNFLLIMLNRPKKTGTSSQYKGVGFSKKDKVWVSRIKVNGKTISLGSYKSEKEAAIAYNTKAFELYGDLVTLNKIN